MFLSVFSNQFADMWAMILSPLLAASISALFLRKSKWGAAALSIISAGFALILALGLLLSADNLDIRGGACELFKLGGFSLKFGFILDSLSANMLFVLCFVGFLIHIFSVGYMNDDPAKGRFFGGLSFFMFSMTGIVLADNLFMMFIFWEFVGFSSYMLIAHYADTDYSKMASKKAFIANRIGDFGFLLGIILCYYTLGTANFSEIAEILKADPAKASTAIALLLLCGFIGKSAQFPLQVWLTDAMAGPTPVSALIHAATMVAAGVFMTVRLGVIGVLTPQASAVTAFICALMALCAGLWALGQSDIKKTLAYSTLAHLGLMGAAVGMGAYGIAMMHLTMHAFFKAALFLVAGSVIYACHHKQDMFEMGGLWKKMPITAFVALIASLSTLSAPFFAGYYSKEMILNVSYLKLIDSVAEGGIFNIVIFAMIFGAAILTPLYMGRLFFAVFMGKPKSAEASHAKESSLWMTLPLLVLAVYSLAGAYSVVCNFKWLGGKMAALMPESTVVFMKSVFGWEYFHALVVKDGFGIEVLGYVVLLCALLMILAAYFMYGRGEDKLKANCPLLYSALESHGWFDDIYNYYIAKVQQRFALLLATLDCYLIQGFFVKGSALLASLAGLELNGMHRKWVSNYAVWMFVGIAAMIVIFVF